MSIFRPPKTPEEAESIRLQGRHSNYPECCINWFIFVRTRLPSGFLEWRMHFLKTFFLFQSRPGYVRCLSCFIHGRKVEVHRCNTSCHGQAGHCRSSFCAKCEAERAKNFLKRYKENH